MRPWTLAFCLTALRNQINAAHPSRSKASDGTIGDAAHAREVSDHNPDSAGVVRAFDITHDPADGLDCQELAAALTAARDQRVKYLIWNGRILRAYPKPGIPAWTWSTYHGTDPHTNHLHVSVVADARATHPTPWTITTTPPGDDDMTPAQAAQLTYISAQLKTIGRQVTAVTKKVDYVSAQARAVGSLVIAGDKETRDKLSKELDDITIALEALDTIPSKES